MGTGWDAGVVRKIMMKALLLAALLLAALSPAPAHATPDDIPNPATWVTNGPVYAIARTPTTVYLGGNFTWVGPVTGYGAPLSAATGQPLVTFPKVDGTVRACVADGSGGWFIGGIFSQVGAFRRNNLAHILADGRVDPAWNPGANNWVQTLVVAGGKLYAGGAFTNIGGQTRGCLAALDASSGAVTPWNPNANGGDVMTLMVSGTTVYAGGWFTSIGGQARNHSAALDITSGAATAWKANIDGSVQALALAGGMVFIGGEFSQVNGQARRSLVAVDPLSGALTAWNPSFTEGAVHALAVSGGTLYAGGQFNKAGWQAWRYLAAFDISSGALMPWNPDANGGVTALAISGGTVYAGGWFSSMGGQPRHNLAAIDAASGAATAWDPNADNEVDALAVSGGTVYAGGQFTSIGGVTRNNLAAFDAVSGAATAWNPNPDSRVYALAVSGGTVYAGGLFAHIGGQGRNYLAALDAATGTATDWNPNPNNAVSTLVVSGGTVYAAGAFTSIGGQARNYIVAFDAATGAVTAWNPNLNNSVRCLAVVGGTVYIGGDFSSIGGQTRNWLAAVDAITGQATAWNPNPNGGVKTLAVLGGTVYIGGWFTNVGGQTRNHLAAFDTATGAVTAWNPNANGTVTDLVASGGNFLAGGEFTSMGGQSRSRLAALDAASGTVLAWSPNADASVEALTASGGTVYAGGEFTSIGGQPQAYFAQFDTSLPMATPTAPDATDVQTNSITWAWTDASNNEDGFKVWADPGTGTPATLRATTDADATSWLHGGLSPNTQYTFQVAATNAAGDSARSAAYTTWTLIEPVSALTFPSVTATSIAVAPANTPSNLTAGLSGIYISNDTAVTASGWLQTTAPWVSSSLTPNTLYAFRGRSRNGARISGVGASASLMTLASPPSPGNNIACDRTAGLAYPFGTTFTFSNPAGFGAGTHGGGAYKVSACRWSWDTSPGHSFSGGEAQWTVGTLTQTPATPGSYYLHLQSLNGAGVATPQTLDLGPFIVTATPPAITTQPAGQTVNPGATVTFSVAATGTAPLSYQWKKNGAAISGATAVSYTITSVDTSDAAVYTCVVTNPAGSVTANPARLIVNPTLTVASVYGAPTPSAGAHVYTTGTLISASVSGSPIVDTTGTCRQLCTGWTGTGSVAASGTTTQTSFRLGLDSALTWRWQTQYRLDATVTPPGTGRVTLDDGVTSAEGSWHNAYKLTGIRAVPSPGYALARWSGDAGGTASTYTLSMHKPRAVTARFARAGALDVNRAGLSFLKGSRWEVDVRRGGAPTTQTLTLTNTGELPVSFTGGAAGTPGLALAGRCAGDFAIQSVSPSTAAPLAPGASLTVTVRFAPQRSQYTLGLDAALVVTSDSPLTPTLSLPLLGDAVPVALSGFSVN